jgi:hypothetical protein
MENQTKENEKSETESGDPGRTPGSAEGDRETVEADLKEKHLSDDTENSENDDKTK